MMKLKEYIGNKSLPSANIAVGIDIGSRQAKAVLLKNDEFYTALTATGFDMTETAETLISELLNTSGLERKDISYIVITGYGRVAVSFSDIPGSIVTEIACHGMGAHYLAEGVKTIIDIGGQDSKAIKIDPETGKVLDFAMNDKCAAGTGRFLERIAAVLGEDVNNIGEISIKSDNPASISAQCIVFAESEIISGRAKGLKVEDLSAGINISVVTRVANLVNRIGIEENILFTGGVSNNIGIRKAFEKYLEIPFVDSKLDTVYAGAFGAAVFASERSVKGVSSLSEEGDRKYVDLYSLQTAVENEKELIASGRTGKKKTVGYTCAYVPVEILGAADVAYYRIIHAGTQDEVMAGESVTQSVFCDMTKSVLGQFITENPLTKATDQVYTFYTCDCMKNTVEAIDNFYVPATLYNMPRLREEKSSLEYFKSEVLHFKEDVEKLTGKKITDKDINRNIALYNEAKKMIREISEYRKKDKPVISGSEFKQIAMSYYYLPVEVLIRELKKILEQLKDIKLPKVKSSKPRILLSGGVAADGDEKVLKILEEMGADVVAEDNCTGLRPFLNDVPNTGIWDEDIAKGYLGKAPCARMKPLNHVVENSLSLAKEYDVDAVVFYFLKFCPCYSMIIRKYTDIFQENNILILVITSDYAHGDEGQIKIRVEAFMEMLESKEGKVNE